MTKEELRALAERVREFRSYNKYGLGDLMERASLGAAKEAGRTPLRKFEGGGVEPRTDSTVISTPVQYVGTENVFAPEYEQADQAGAAFNRTWLSNRRDILEKNAKAAEWKDPSSAYDTEIGLVDNTPTQLSDSRYSNGAGAEVLFPTKTNMGKDYGNMVAPARRVYFDYFNGEVPITWGVHEVAHSLGLNKPQEVVIKNRDIKPVSGEKDPYLDSPTEIYSRLQEVRNASQLDPNRVYTTEDLDQWREEAATIQKELNEGTPFYKMDVGPDAINSPFRETRDRNIFNRYSDEDLLFLLNDVAQNPLDKDYTNYAARGGKLQNSFEPGGGIPTLEEYYTKQADAARIAAHQNSLNRDRQKDVIVGYETSSEAAAPYYKEASLLKELADEASSKINPMYDYFAAPRVLGRSDHYYENIHSDDELRRLLNDEYQDFVDGLSKYRVGPESPFVTMMKAGAEGYNTNSGALDDIEKYAPLAEESGRRADELQARSGLLPIYDWSCLATATDNYGEGHYEAYNPYFYANPEKYGFMRIPLSDLLPGDIVQDSLGGSEPHHALIFNGFNSEGIPTYNYSSGDPVDYNVYHKNSTYWLPSEAHPFTDGQYFAYRFVGNDADKQRWKEEYDKLYSSGGKLSKLAERLQQVGYYKEGGKIHIDPSKKGTFTAAAKKHGKSVQGFASQVLAHKENYSPAMVKKANFARNAAKWHK